MSAMYRFTSGKNHNKNYDPTRILDDVPASTTPETKTDAESTPASTVNLTETKNTKDKQINNDSDVITDRNQAISSINIQHRSMSRLAGLFVLNYLVDYEPTPEELEAQRKYLEEKTEREKHSISTLDHFQRVARVEGDNALGVKVLRDKTGVLHFMDTKVWPFHYPFCVSNLGETRTLQEFNEQVYTGKDRSMMFATVVSYPRGTGRYYCLELNPADPMTDFDAVNGFFEDVKKNFFHTDDECLHFHPTSSVQIEAIKGKTLNLPVITSETIYGCVQYKVVMPGWLKAKTVHVFSDINASNEELNQWLLKKTPQDIVVIPRVPNDIPVVGGVICGEIIPPLCHVALLCQNRKTPCCFVDNAVELVQKGGVSQGQCNGVITKTGFYLDCAFNASAKRGEPAPKIEIQAPNTSVANLIDFHFFKQYAKDIHIVGAKAAQLATIESIFSQPIFKGTFVIPFHHYDTFIYKNSVISTAVQNKITRVKDNAEHYVEFARVQEMIMKQKIDDELVKSVMKKIKQHNMTSVIFRSSTNAEDLTGFNGAGLYESVPLQGQDLIDAQKVGEAIKKVWASVWSPKAVKERAYYKMNHNNVNMAIIVQPYIDEHMTGVKAHYNGVCITHDVARHKVKHGFVVNCFAGDKYRVTNYYKDKSPEQTTLLLGREEDSVDIQIMTTATGHSQSMITQQDAEKMVSMFGSLHTSMLNKPHKLDDTVALDIEFMVVESDKREIVVLQARPYNVNVVSYEEYEENLKQYAIKYRSSYNISQKVLVSTVH